MPARLTKAGFFDELAGRGLWRGFSREERPQLARLLAGLRMARGMTVLEPGCGTGRLTERLLKRVGPRGRVIANDISPCMIAAARRRRLGRRVRWHVGPVEGLALRDGVVDRVVCFQSFPHFDDKVAALRLFRRALRPGGLLVIVHFAGSRKINRIHRNEAGPIRHDLIPRRREMKGLLKGAGFVEESFEDSTQGYWLFARPHSAREVAGAFRA